MVGIRSLFVVLWILPTITSELPEYSSRNSVIDWSTCGVHTKCYCLDENSIIDQVGTGIPKADESIIDATKEGRCNIGVQTKYFTNQIAVLQLQVFGDNTKLGTDPQLTLNQGPKELFGCKLHSDSKKYTLVGDAKIIKDNKISLFDDRIRIESGIAICALKIKRAKKLKDWLTDNDGSEQRIWNFKTTKTMLKLISTVPVEYQFKDSNFIFLISMGASCDPFSFKKTMKSSSNYQIEKLKNIDRDVLNCAEYNEKSPRYAMRYANSSHQDIKINEFKCLHSDDGASFQFDDEYGQTVLVAEPDQYYFYCAAEDSEVCQNPIQNCNNAAELCPNFEEGKKGTPALLSCKDKRWIINDVYYELRADPDCRRHPIKQNTAVFHTVFKDHEDVTTPNARCFEDYDCRKKKTDMVYHDCDKCIDYRDGIMTCKDPEIQLNIYVPRSNKTMLASNYTCDKRTGQWKDDKGALLPEDSQVQCPGKFTAKSEVSMTPEKMALTIGGIIAGCVTFLLIFIVAVYCYYFKPRVFMVKGKRGWIKSKTSYKIAYSKDLFNKVSQATIDTNCNIVHGFKFIELLLDTETAEPQIWEDAYQFLMRFQGAIEKLDRNVSRMFMRYLLLQAKKIIDTHGWLSDQPITKSTKNQKELMRCVAIRLLSFSFHDPKDDEAEKLALSGFRKLLFKAVDQYPHCGLLWSIMLHDRVLGNCKVIATSEIQLFDREAFEKIIYEIAFTDAIEMPDEDIIPEFGSPAQQASFALGGSPNVYLHKNEKLYKDHENVKDSVRMKYFAGMGASLGRNPGPMITPSFKMNNANFNVTDLHKISNENEWNAIVEQTMKIMVNYGRALDAKRLQTRFMPKVPQPSDLFRQLKYDQSLFEEAAEEHMKSLRKFFAERTDKEELKSASVCKKDATLEAAVYAQMQKQNEERAEEAKRKAEMKALGAAEIAAFWKPNAAAAPAPPPVAAEAPAAAPPDAPAAPSIPPPSKP